MHIFQLKYLLYLLLNGVALFFLFASIMGIPGNPDPHNKKEQRILNLFGKLLVVTFRGIPALAVLALVAFLFHYDKIGQLISYLNFLFGFTMIILMVTYYKIKS